MNGRDLFWGQGYAFNPLCLRHDEICNVDRSDRDMAVRCAVRITGSICLEIRHPLCVFCVIIRRDSQVVDLRGNL